MNKKKISKKLTAVVVSMVLCVLNCMPAFAYEGWSEDPCPKCHADVAVWVSESRRGVSTTGLEQKCTHCTYGTDLFMVLTYDVYYECQECGYSWTGERGEPFWECHGYEYPCLD